MADKFELWSIEFDVHTRDSAIYRALCEARNDGTISPEVEDKCRKYLSIAGSDKEDLGEQRRVELVALLESSGVAAIARSTDW
jgi:hypothetical protein